MQNQNSLGELITLTLIIVIMLGGLTMMVGGPSLTRRLYRWLFQNLVLAPLSWGVSQVWNGIELFLRWCGQQLWHLLLWLGQQIGQLLWWGVGQTVRIIGVLLLAFGRGIRWAWVRLIT
ncbi:MAG: hypothetical protein A2544_00675 [Candidatus Zambryskibacteria bacterium RIFOXYD2_FULL_43_10]|uniref:Uncharacterized protein n=1 Tax=Candidatus Zambryskibacteria bacterium RIFOXYD2_FULL_43_10 TaxID=1802782 RepID=A0A1G2V7H5_9BACT|nr:MAG: hypothetical protein A2544_00675 [Candidatus Zambryskibacteria bacterium RIFOXYD2_FULL_43_10]